MDLRERPVELTATLPDGRVAAVWVGLARDPYIRPEEIDTVGLELRVDGELTATLNTVLDPDQYGEARDLAREIADGLESGRLEPTAGAIEPLAEQAR